MATKVKLATVENALTEMDERTHNLRIWNALGKTDPAHTKSFSRAGGFKGTAIKPIWVTQRLTEQFGPCGIGWGIGEPRFEWIPAGEGEALVYCTVSCWHGSSENVLYGVGGDKVMTTRRDGAVFVDDEAYKKAFTDAVGNAFKFIGVGADVHMGLFDDSKYVAEVNAEFHPKPDPPKKRDDPFPQGPATGVSNLKVLGRALWRDVEACGDSDELEILLADKTNKLIVKQIIEALPRWWDGGCDKDGNSFEGLEAVIARKRREFEQEKV